MCGTVLHCNSKATQLGPNNFVYLYQPDIVGRFSFCPNIIDTINILPIYSNYTILTHGPIICLLSYHRWMESSIGRKNSRTIISASEIECAAIKWTAIERLSSLIFVSDWKEPLFCTVHWTIVIDWGSNTNSTVQCPAVIECPLEGGVECLWVDRALIKCRL